MIQILIVDDHPLVREGLKQLFSDEDDIVVSGEAGNGEEALRFLQDKTVDLVLLDVTLPGIHGAELIEKIRKLPNTTPILVLSMHDECEIAKSQLKAGANGYITKDISPKELLSAIRKVAAGGRCISAGIAEKIAFEVPNASALVPHDLLSVRELLILRMLAQGKKVNEIALELHISNKTVSTHKIRLMQKMHIDSDFQLIQYTLANDLGA
jgi:DNA-binding NarL/FixJ family response regulator